MTTSLDHELLEVAALNEALVAGKRWEHGPLTSIEAQRIGVEFGFSGRVYRLHLHERSGGPASIVAKIEHADGIARAVAFRDRNEARFAEHIPVSYGHCIDTPADRGLLLLEDVSPATQGNDLTSCTAVQAGTIVRLVAMLHASTWISGRSPTADATTAWAERNWAEDQWNDQLTRAALRFPDGFDAVTKERLADLPSEVAHAHDELTHGPHAWVHRDPHPDNALWRLDGRLVLLDWSNAMIAPPAIDVAVLLSSLSFRADAPLSAQALLTEYSEALVDNGLDTDEHEIRRNAAAAVRLLIRGSIGWVGKANEGGTPARAQQLQAQVADRTKSALRWLDC